MPKEPIENTSKLKKKVHRQEQLIHNILCAVGSNLIKFETKLFWQLVMGNNVSVAFKQRLLPWLYFFGDIADDKRKANETSQTGTLSTQSSTCLLKYYIR